MNTSMFQQPVGRLILKLAIPTTMGMLVTSGCSMVDTFFIGKLGVTASGAAGIVFSLITFIQAMGYTVGMGAGTQISQLIGKGQRKDVECLSNSAVCLSIIVGIIFSVFAWGFLEPLLKVLGATESVLPEAVGYGRAVVVTAPFLCGTFVLSTILRSQGRAVASMLGIVMGAVLHIALDPLLMFTAHMGVTGAGMALFISQGASFSLLFFLLYWGKISGPFRKKQSRIYRGIITRGLPSFYRQGTAVLSVIILNRLAGAYGDLAIASFSIAGKVFMLLFSILIGISQGYQPVIGYHFGAGNRAKVRQAFWFAVAVGTAVAFIASIIGIFFSKELMQLFLKTEFNGRNIGSEIIQLQSYVVLVLPFCMIANITFQSVGRTMFAAITSCARQGIFYLPLIFPLNALFKVKGLELVQPLADVLTFLLTIILVRLFFKVTKK
ncbi:MAG: MATE family efflux transporter [Lachnospiraceae bacterium]